MQAVSDKFASRLASSSAMLVYAVISFSDGTESKVNGSQIKSMSYEQATSSDSSFGLGGGIAGKLSITLANTNHAWDKFDFTDATVRPYVGMRFGELTSIGESDSSGVYVEVMEGEDVGSLTAVAFDATGQLEDADVSALGGFAWKVDGAQVASGPSYSATAGASVSCTLGSASVTHLVTTEEWVPKGVYVVDQPDSYGDDLSLTCNDQLSLFSRHSFSDVTYSFPATLYDVVEACCNKVGIAWHAGSDAISNSLTSYSVPERLAGLDKLSLMQVVAYAAQCIGCYARMRASDGSLLIGEYDLSARSDSSVRVLSAFSSLTVGIGDIAVTGVQVTAQNEVVTDSDGNASNGNDGETALSGSAGYVLAIENNPLVVYGQASAVAQAAYARVGGLKFRTFDCSASPDPRIEPGDPMRIEDRLGNVYDSYVTSVSVDVNGKMELKCAGETPSRSLSENASAISRAIVEARAQISRERSAREKARDELTDKLENSPGMYKTEEVDSDGQVTYYLHDKPTIASSAVVWKMTSTAIGISTDGGKTYANGLTADGTAILNRVYAIGIDASHITTGMITDAKGNNYWNLDTGDFEIANISDIDKHFWFDSDGAHISAKRSGAAAKQTLGSNVWKIADKDGNTFAIAEDMRDDSGVATFVDTYNIAAGDSATGEYFQPVWFFAPAADNLTVESGESDSGPWTVLASGNGYTYDAANHSLTINGTGHYRVTVKTNSVYAKRYGFGTRAASSKVGPFSYAMGYNVESSGLLSCASGDSSVASGADSYAGGYLAVASGDGSYAYGSGVKASGGASHAEGSGSVASGTDSHAEGYSSTASGGYSHAEGNGGVASGDCSHVEGGTSTASGMYSHAEGYRNTASGEESHAEGYENIATGSYSHVEGYGGHKYTTKASRASGAASHAEGTDTVASGNSSHAEGDSSTASGPGSHAEGSENIASGSCAHAEGAKNVASASCSHAEGLECTASGANSHANGVGVKAAYEHQTAIGKYNANSNSHAFEIGNGSWGDGNESNAFYVDWDGNASLGGGMRLVPGGNASSLAETFPDPDGLEVMGSGDNTHTSGINTAGKIYGNSLTTDSASVSGALTAGSATLGTPLPVASGGTGATTAADAFKNISGGYTLDLGTENQTDTWVPVLKKSTIQHRWIPTVPFPVSAGGTGATDAAHARANLGLGSCVMRNGSGLTNAWVGIWNGNTSDPGYRLETCWFVNGAQRGLCVDTYNRLRFYGSGVNNWSLGNLSGDKNMIPVYRLYNQYNSQHLFVSSESEYNNLVKAGWTGEGIKFYAFK